MVTAWISVTASVKDVEKEVHSEESMALFSEGGCAQMGWKKFWLSPGLVL